MPFGVLLATPVAACGTVTYSQQVGNLPVPTFNFHGQLNSVAAASANDAWAVGFSGTYSRTGTLMLHWDGRAWSRVTSPAVLDGVPGMLSRVTAVSASDAWAVGFTKTVPGSGGQAVARALLVHWNGTRWSQVTDLPTTASSLSGIAMSRHGGWAVGTSVISGHSQPLILRWDGAAWHRVPAPVGAGDPSLMGVAATSASTAWAIGTAAAPGDLTGHGVLMRWSGNSWQWASFPIAGPKNSLSDIAAGPDGTAWAVGQDATMTPMALIAAPLAAAALYKCVGAEPRHHPSLSLTLRPIQLTLQLNPLP